MRSWLNLAVRLGGIADAMEYKVTQQLEFIKIQLGLLARRDSDTYYLSTNAEVVDFLSSCHLWASSCSSSCCGLSPWLCSLRGLTS